MPAPAGKISGDDRLDSWKEIAAYLGREGRTVQGWEKLEGLPVHRHQHARQGSVYAFRSELDTWREARRGVPEPSASSIEPESAARPAKARSLLLAGVVGAVALLAAAVVWWMNRY